MSERSASPTSPKEPASVTLFRNICDEQRRAFEEQEKALKLLAEIEAREKALKKAEEDQEELIRQLLTQNEKLAGENANLTRVINMYRAKELSDSGEK
jgi:hypothetical protein